ncbi:MAG TPA: GNAT family N-acetyltransferase [Usitatibacter sp.]|nr:GNAT family N-acetyltransferase [Usitatibacter sp.]
MHWHFAKFDELSPRDIHDLFQARVAVFVLEQKCPFQDVDGADPHCWHLIGRDSPGGEVLAYCRLVPPGVKYPEPSIGRVLTTAGARGSGAGRRLMAEALARCERLWPGQPLRIGAQQYLERFYGDYGFARSSEPYDEDGIMHIEMVR